MISLRNDFPICAIPNGGLRRASWATFLKLMKMPCAVSGPQVHLGPGVLERPDARLEHEVEVAFLGEVAIARLAGVLARALAALGALEMIGAEAELARPAVDERVAESADVPRCDPHVGVEDDRRVERDDVVPLLHHRLEPACLDVVLQEDAVVAVVVRRAEAAVDLR